MLAPLNHPTLTKNGGVLIKEGILPLLPPLSSPSSPFTHHLPHKSGVYAEMKTPSSSLLSSSTARFCLRSSQKKNPPQPLTSQCDEVVSWRNHQHIGKEMDGHDDQQQRGTVVHILNTGRIWDDTSTTTIHDAVEEDDVTLAMTMQITSTQSLDVYALDDLLDVAESNMVIWASSLHFQQQPCVLLLHVAGATEEVKTKLAKRFQNDNFSEISHKDDGSSSRGRHYLESCLISAIFSKSTNEHVSRKALMNMAMEAAPTRWVITGLELERGMILSKEISVLAKRAAKVHRDIAGNVFWIPQFATDDDFLFSTNKDEENSGLFSSVSVKTFFDAYEQQKPLITNRLAQFDCSPCDKGVEDEEVEQRINNLWWDLTKVELSGGDLSESKFSAGTDDESLNNLARYINEIEISLTELLSDEKKDTIKRFDKSPIMMIDKIGPRDGMITSDFAPEVDEFGGQLCYNALRIAQLAALGYRLNVLQGAFAVSVPSSRDAICNNLSMGILEDKNVAHHSLSRCDSCFMFDNKNLAWSIARDEKQRPVKAAVLWHEYDNKVTGNK